MSSNKSFSSETANRYALALYELAKENSELEIIEKNINEFLAVYNTSEDLKNFIKNVVSYHKDRYRSRWLDCFRQS